MLKSTAKKKKTFQVQMAPVLSSPPIVVSADWQRLYCFSYVTQPVIVKISDTIKKLPHTDMVHQCFG